MQLQEEAPAEEEEEETILMVPLGDRRHLAFQELPAAAVVVVVVARVQRLIIHLSTQPKHQHKRDSVVRVCGHRIATSPLGTQKTGP